ncbi:MAG: hypothetical protein H3C62_04610 [Gemmatimonadaceae bacterium]|nr:hypothetical protein [Gemmatimonadaceae bacterium]
MRRTANRRSPVNRRRPPLRRVTRCGKRFRVDAANYGRATIVIDLGDAIDRDLEQFLDFICTQAFGCDVVQDVNYEVIGLTKERGLRVRVTGDVSYLLAERAHT